MTTHVLIVVDKSGSMGPLTNDVIGGFNSYIDSLQADRDGTYRITVTVFDTHVTDLCVNTTPTDTPRLNNINYRPDSYTALYDAVGYTIVNFEKLVPVLAKDDRVLLVVQTDGHENASQEFTSAQIADMITQRRDTGRWSCIYLGQHADAWDQSRTMGFDQGSTVVLSHSAAGTQSGYTGLFESTFVYGRGASADDATQALRTIVEKGDTK